MMWVSRFMLLPRLLVALAELPASVSLIENSCLVVGVKAIAVWVILADLARTAMPAVFALQPGAGSGRARPGNARVGARVHHRQVLVAAEGGRTGHRPSERRDLNPR